MYAQERLLLPNYGREPAAFFDYVVEHYKQLPSAVVFLHGHGGSAWHTSCLAILSRSRRYYEAMASKNDVANHMITLTSRPDGSVAWNGGNGGQAARMGGNFASENATLNACWSIIRQWNVSLGCNNSFLPSLVPTVGCTGFLESCCASFIIPAEKVRLHPVGFYVDIKAHVIDPAFNDQLTARACFEHIIYRLYQESTPTPSLLSWYNAGNSAYDIQKCSTEAHQKCIPDQPPPTRLNNPAQPVAAARKAKVDCALKIVASLQPFDFKSSMPIFVAHYSKLLERAVFMRHVLARHNLTAQFIRQFDKEELQPDHLECLMAADSETRRRYDKKLMLGEISDFVKHLAAFSAIQRNNCTRALVLEDDVQEDGKLPTTLVALLSEAMGLLPPDFDILFVGGCLGIKCSQSAQRISGKGVSLCRAERSRCGDAYIISLQGAAKLIKSLPIRAPIDWQMNYESSVLNMWYSDPPLFSQNNTLIHSNIRS